MKKFVSLFVVLFLLSACSEKPSDAQIEKAYILFGEQQVLHSGIKDASIEIKNFKKINGFEKDAKTYIATVECDFVMTQHGKEKLTLNKTEKGWIVTIVEDIK